MANLVVVFLTGLTTGGLSCLAVQGGLLASSVAQQAEQTFRQHIDARSTTIRTAQKRKAAPQPNQQHAAAPATAPKHYAGMIALFLGAKLVAYTLLGFLLGWLGSVLQLTPFTQALLQLGIGIFMVGSALRMLNVHPFFRYFAIEPPAFVTRYIRRTAKNSADHIVTPLFLGALTVLIPCGVTQVMMATAIASGSPLEGAVILFAFILGTSPLFFALAYLATQLGKTLEARFMQVVAVIVLVLGLVSINSGLTLAGAPLFPARPASVAQGKLPSSAGPTTQPGVQGNIITINVTDYSYEPGQVQAPANQPLHLKLVTNGTYG